MMKVPVFDHLVHILRYLALCLWMCTVHPFIIRQHNSRLEWFLAIYQTFINCTGETGASVVLCSISSSGGLPPMTNQAPTSVSPTHFGRTELTNTEGHKNISVLDSINRHVIK